MKISSKKKHLQVFFLGLTTVVAFETITRIIVQCFVSWRNSCMWLGWRGPVQEPSFYAPELDVSRERLLMFNRTSAGKNSNTVNVNGMWESYKYKCELQVRTGRD